MERAHVHIIWRASLMDSILTWFGNEGVKGPWAVRIAGRTVLFAFDDQVAMSPDISQADKDTLRRITIFEA